MIGFFPELYPDELVYSVLARYYVRTGYGIYRSVAEELFADKSIFAEIEFIHRLKSEVLDLITKDFSMEELIMSHTMFPYYGRFIPKERRDKAFQALFNMDGNYQQLLPISKNRQGIKRYLRYCPICAKEDREVYGETYWHRIHQMEGVNVCPVHGCQLYESNVVISRKSNSTIVSAEEVISDNLNVCYSSNQLEIELAKYIMNIFQTKIDIKSDVTIGQFLHSKLAYTKYVSPRGQQRRIRLLLADFNEYYRDLPEFDFKELHMLQGLFLDRRYNLYEISMLGMFLNINPVEFEHMILPEKTQEQEFDKRVRELHQQGLNYREIATLLNAPYDVVKPVGEYAYGKYKTKKSRRKQEYAVRKKDWTKEDEEMLPVVISAIKCLQGKDGSRPRKISVYSVSKKLGISREHIRYNLPICKAEIEKYQEPQEKYWAREVTWAAKEILREERIITWSRLARMTNTRLQNLVACIPYLDCFAGEKLKEQIVAVITE